MNWYELMLLCVLIGTVWFWLDSMKAREIGIQAARNACAEGGLGFSTKPWPAFPCWSATTMACSACSAFLP